MSWLSALGGFLIVAVALAIAYRPFGDYMAWAYTSPRHWKIERAIYRLLGVDQHAEQTWPAYLRGVLTMGVVGALVLYAVQRLQRWLPYSLGLPVPSEHLSFNTALSYVTNTNWQSASPEATLGYTVQFAGLAVQNFVSAAIGIAVAVTLMRGFVYRRSTTIGNFWVDLVRGTLRILLPVALIGSVALLVGGVVQNFHATDVTTLTGVTQRIPGGPVASQEAIKLLGTNGGGFFTANSAHPFENPTAVTNLVEVVMMLLIPFSLPRTFGRIVADHRQGYAIVSVMATLYVASVGVLTALESRAWGLAPALAGAAMEGKEQRFGIAGSALFAATSTATSTGAVNSAHDSYTALGSMVLMINMMLGEIAPGGAGSGIYSLLILAVIAVFIAGLLVGRTPEYLGKKIGPREIKLAALTILVMPTLALVATSLSFALPGVRDEVTRAISNPGIHGMTEVLYAFTSAANNNGSAFAGLNADTPWLNTALGVVMVLGRFAPMVFVLALAGSFAAQDVATPTAGTLPTHRPMFIGLLVVVTVVVSALTFFPVLALGPLAEGLR